jgi:hypothetical protein
MDSGYRQRRRHESPHPPLSERTPLASLDCWNLVLRCPNCGDRIKPVSSLFAFAHPTDEIGSVIPRLSCVCKAKPVALFGTTTWAVKYGHNPVREDWSFLLPKQELKAA